MLVREGAPTDNTELAQRLRSMHVSANRELARAATKGEIHKLARRLEPASGGGGAVRKLLDALVANQPATHAIASLGDRLQLPPLSRPLEDILADAYLWDIVQLHVQPPALTISPSDRPFASPLARLQAGTRDTVTTLLHMQVGIADANALRLLPLVDGTRTRAELASAVKQIAVGIDPSRATDFVKYALEKYARLGLLMTDAVANTSRGQ